MSTKSDRKGTAVATKDNRKPPKISLETRPDGVVEISGGGDFARLQLATGNVDVSSELLGQIAGLGSYGNRTDVKASNFVLGFIDSMKPKDPTEVLLLTQMGAVHQATMMMARRLNHVENIPQQDAAERALNKLARTFAAQADTLKRYRSKGQQTVRVERVTVNEGGQAIVGSVKHGGGAVKKTDVYPMQSAQNAPRCTAKSKRTGLPCQNPAVRGFQVCRMHGARGGAKPGAGHPNYRHGVRSRDAVALRALINNMIGEAVE